jgi:hypothetical protein
VLGDVELVHDDHGLGAFQVGLGELDVRFPHVRGDGVDPLPLGRGEGGPEAVLALLLPVIREVEDPPRSRSATTERYLCPFAMAFSSTPRWATTSCCHRARPRVTARSLIPPSLVPGDPEEVRGPLDVALPEEVNGEALEKGGELMAGFGPGHRKLLHPVGGALHPADLGLDPGRELAGVQVPRAAARLVVAWHWGLALGKGEGPVSCGHRDDPPLCLHVEVHVHHGPGRGEA